MGYVFPHYSQRSELVRVQGENLEGVQKFLRQSNEVLVANRGNSTRAFWWLGIESTWCTPLINEKNRVPF